MKIKSAQILVLGAGGVIGGPLVEELVGLGHKVTEIRRTASESRQASNDKVETIYLDANNGRKLRKAVESNHYDVVIDLLSYSRSRMIRNLKIFRSNKPQYIFVSTAAIFDKTPNPITESSSTLPKRVWSYVDGKLAAEKVLRSRSKEFGIKFTIVRPYIVYSEKRVPAAYWEASQIVGVARMGLPIALPEYVLNKNVSISSGRDVSKAISSLVLDKKAFNEDFNISNPELVSWRQVISSFATAGGHSFTYTNMSKEQIVQNFPELKGKAEDRSSQKTFDISKFLDLFPSFSFRDNAMEAMQSYPQRGGVSKYLSPFFCIEIFKDARRKSRLLPDGICCRWPISEDGGSRRQGNTAGKTLRICKASVKEVFSKFQFEYQNWQIS